MDQIDKALHEAALNDKKQKVWKDFGRETEAGQVLYKLFQTGKPAQINYPPTKPRKEQPKIYEKKPCPQQTQIQYPKVKQPEKIQISKVDMIPHRKPYEQIAQEIEQHYQQPPSVPFKQGQNREEMIKNLQNKNKLSRGVLSKEMQLPQSELIDYKQLQQSDEARRKALQEIKQQNIIEKLKIEKMNQKKLYSNQDEELSDLFDQILVEIEERQIYLEQIQNLNEPKLQNKIKQEIIERVSELQKISELQKKNQQKR